MSLAEDHALLVAAVREAGALALSHFRRDPKTWTKAGGDPVSEADIAVDTLLKETLLAARPDYGWLSEETEDDAGRRDRRRVWIVDPIDGTRAFIRGDAEFTVCAAMVEDGRPLVAAVFNPATDEFFQATAGGGAMLNGRAMWVSERETFDNARLLASSRTIRSAIEKLAREPATFDAVNSIAYRLSLVACGRYDATFSLGPKSDWDLAAADLIVAEAGGQLTDADGRKAAYNRAAPRHESVVAAGPVLHAELLRIIAEL